MLFRSYKNISGTKLRNQGVAVKPNAILRSAKASLPTFQWVLCTSGSVATPTSPIAPCLLSGLISKNGTAVVMGLIAAVVTYIIRKVCNINENYAYALVGVIMLLAGVSFGYQIVKKIPQQTMQLM